MIKFIVTFMIRLLSVSVLFTLSCLYFLLIFICNFLWDYEIVKWVRVFRVRYGTYEDRLNFDSTPLDTFKRYWNLKFY